MKIHEYQGKAVLASFGVPVPKGKVAYTAAEAVEIGKELGFPVVVKAQIHAGGRGKGGGVKVAKDAAEAVEVAKKILGMTLITHQTGPDGRVVHRLLVEETLPIDRELYLGLVLDRVSGKSMDPVTTGQIYWGAIPFVLIQCIAVGLVIAIPAMVMHYKGSASLVDPSKIKIDIQLPDLPPPLLDFGAPPKIQ